VKPDKLEIGKLYVLRNSPDCGYVKPVEIIRPGTWQMKELAKEKGIKPFRCIVVKCEHISCKDSAFGFIRYFRAVDIIERKKEAV
jgi:hypothetical protein